MMNPRFNSILALLIHMFAWLISLQICYAELKPIMSMLLLLVSFSLVNEYLANMVVIIWTYGTVGCLQL